VSARGGNRVSNGPVSFQHDDVVYNKRMFLIIFFTSFWFCFFYFFRVGVIF
jgi:hypothetical protein